MIFDRGVPKEISAVKLKKWYRSLDDRDKNRLARYATGADTTSQIAFITDLMSKANTDKNYPASLVAGEFGETLKFNNEEKFDFYNEYIEALFNSGDIPRAKDLCYKNIELVPEVISHITKNGIPEYVPCRNRLIDIMIGSENDYDGAQEMLIRFNELNILSDEDLGYRTQSLKIHKLQRTFDSIFSHKVSE